MVKFIQSLFICITLLSIQCNSGLMDAIRGEDPDGDGQVDADDNLKVMLMAMVALGGVVACICGPIMYVKNLCPCCPYEEKVVPDKMSLEELGQVHVDL